MIKQFKNIFIAISICGIHVVTAQNPGGVSGTMHWYKADDVITSGTSVSQINDLSGNDHDATQSDVTEQPQIVAGELNGNQVIRFDGNSDHLPIAKKSYSVAGEIQSLNTFVVYKTSFSSGSINNNWALIDYDRSDVYNFYVGGNGRIGLSYRPQGGSTVDRSSTSVNNDEGIPKLASALFDASLVNDTKLRVNGVNEVDENIVGDGVGIGRGTNTRFGFIGDGSEANSFDGNRNNRYYNGDIAEIVVYENTTLDALSVNKVETYLGVKYGLHLGHDFVESSGTVIWNSTTNSDYHNLVTAIARDNNSGLNQTRSVNQDGGLVTIESSSPLNDKDYLIWGSNNNSMSYSTFNTPADCVYKLERIWKTEMNNIVSNVNVSIDISALGLPLDYGVGNIELVINSSDDFTSGSLTVSAASFDGSSVTFNNVNFKDGGYFSVCFNKIITTDLFADATFWLKADKDTYENTAANNATEDGDGIRRWLDQTSNNLNAINRVGLPVFDNNATTLNFISDVDFSVGNHLFGINNSSLINDGTFSKKSLFTTLRTGSDITSTQVVYEEGGTVNGLNLYISGGNLYVSVWVEGGGSPWEYFLSTPIEANKEYVTGIVYNGNSSNSGYVQLYLNGELKVNQSSGAGLLLSHTGSIGLGGVYSSTKLHTGDFSGNGHYFKGQLQEIIYFNEKSLDEIESRVISSYLALRSGVTLIGDYLNTGYQIIWPSVSNSGYHNGVFGVGRDYKSSLDQRRGTSENENEFIDVRHVSSYSADTSFGIIGHDNGILSWTSSGSPSAGLELVGRVWKVKLNGTGLTDFNISLDTSAILTASSCGAQFAVLVDDNTGFNTGSTVYPLNFDAVQYHITGNISLTDGQFFTIALVKHLTTQTGDFSNASTWLSGITPQNGESFTIEEGHELTLDQNVIACEVGLDENSSLVLSDKTLEITEGTITIGVGATVSKGTSTVVYSKEGNQDVAGIDYYNLLVKNGGTKTVINTSSIENDLGLESTSSNLNANGNITLKSSSSNTARVLELPIGATVSGDFHVQRWVGATARKWWQMGSPVQNATIEEWHDDIPVTGDFPSSDVVGGSDLPSIKWYDETDPSTSSADGWNPAPVNGFYEPIVVGRGYRVYIRETPTDPLNDTVISVTGVPNQGTIDLEATYNGAGGIDAAGWCFVANPYPSTIDWDNSGWTKTRVENAVYVWDALNSRYTSYVDGVGINGGSSKIASSQGFWVRTTGNDPKLTVTEPVKSTEEVFFFKENSEVLFVNIEEGNYKSNTALRFSNQFTEAYDVDRDAYYWGGSYPVNIGTINSNNKYFSINSLPEQGELEIPLYIQHKNDKNKEFTISFDGLGSLGTDSYLTLTDKYTNQTVLIKDNNTEYKFRYDGKSASNGASRFVINKRLNKVLSVTEAVSSNDAYIYPTTINEGGKLQIGLVNTQLESIIITNLNGKIVYEINDDITEQINPNLESGCYIVKLITENKTYTTKVIVQ